MEFSLPDLNLLSNFNLHEPLPDLILDIVEPLPDLNLHHEDESAHLFYDEDDIVDPLPNLNLAHENEFAHLFEDEDEVFQFVDEEPDFMGGEGDPNFSPNGGQMLSDGTQGQSNITRTFLDNYERKAIYDMLLQKSVNGKLKKGVTHMVASHFSVSIRVVQRIWQYGNKSGVNDASHKKIRNCGRKRVQLDLGRVRDVPLRKRTTLRSLAYALETNATTLWRLLKAGKIKRHSNAIKFSLTEENKKSRIRFCLSMLENSSIPHDPIFKGMYNIIYIDEKWFYMTKKSETYYLLPDEEDPLRTTKSKNFIGKVMFLAATARPRFDSEGNVIFSGKIGIFPFIDIQPAQRSSSNRPAGTMITKPMTSVTRQVIKETFISKLLPAIKRRWPREFARETIFIQQDNARTHVDPNDLEIRQAASELSLDIRLMCQPPNSPDLNILDLGFFNAIQSLQHKEAPKNIEELIAAVEKAFDNYPAKRSNHIFLTLQSVMIEILRVEGGQKYRTPHMKKLSLERIGQLPSQLKCDPQLVEAARTYLALG